MERDQQYYKKQTPRKTRPPYQDLECTSSELSAAGSENCEDVEHEVTNVGSMNKDSSKTSRVSRVERLEADSSESIRRMRLVEEYFARPMAVQRDQ